MPDIYTNIGEEAYTELALDGETLKVGLYNDSTDALGDASALGSITTEPTGSAYSRQSTGVTTLEVNPGAFGFENDSQLVFDVSDSTQTVDHAFFVLNFTSDSVSGQGSAQDNLVALASLTQTRDLSNSNQLSIAAGDLTTTCS